MQNSSRLKSRGDLGHGIRALSTCLALASTFLQSIPASANIGESFGFGSRTAAMAGAGAAWGYDGYAAYHNPAAIGSLPDGKRLMLSYGLIFMHPSFNDIKGVVIENGTIGNDVNGGGTLIGEVTMDYRDTLGQMIGAAYRISPEWHNLAAGVTFFLPINQLSYVDTGEQYVPEFVLYRSRTQRPQILLAGSAEAMPGLSFGMGLNVLLSVNAYASAFIQTGNNQPSNGRFNASIKPKLSPYFGAYYAPSGQSTEVGAYTLGLVFRLAGTSPNNLTLVSQAKIPTLNVALPFTFQSNSALFYDPMALELGASYQLTSQIRINPQLEYQFWGNFEPPTLTVQDPTTLNAGSLIITPSQNINYQYRNILVPRLGAELKRESITWRAGYAYRPSMFSELPTGAGNFLDPPKHMLSVGAGFHYDKFLSFNAPWDLNIHLAYQQLVTQHITKTPGDEFNSGTTQTKIGAPGYDAGGKLFGGGVSLSLGF